MAIIKKGILGGFSGKIGSVIGASWRGIDYMRALPRISIKPRTPLQLAQQNKIALLRGFLLSLDEIIERCFQNIKKHTPMNDALSYNMVNSIKGSYAEEQYIDFTQLLFTKGDLRGVWAPKAESTISSTIDFSWENGILTQMCAADDEAILVVYNPEKQQFCVLEKGAFRADKSAELIVPETFKGDSVHCYISFYSVSRMIASTNEYLGTVEVK